MNAAADDKLHVSKSECLVDVLRFWLRHDYRSLMSIASACRIDNGNLHGALSGRRKLSTESICRVANALGIEISESGLDISPSVLPNTVHFLEASPADVSEFGVFNQVGFARGAVRIGWAASPPDEDPAGVYIFMRAGDRSVAVFFDDNCASSGAELSWEVARVVGGEVVGSVFPTAGQWLSWKCRKANPADLDKLFGAPKSASVTEWANLLAHLDTMGLCPADVKSICRDRAMP